MTLFGKKKSDVDWDIGGNLKVVTDRELSLKKTI